MSVSKDRVSCVSFVPLTMIEYVGWPAEPAPSAILKANRLAGNS